MNSRAGRGAKAKNSRVSSGRKARNPGATRRMKANPEMESKTTYEKPVLAILFFLVLVFVLAILAHILFPKEKTQGSAVSPINTTQDGCTPGLRLNCTNALGCEGRKLCVEGKWTECVTQRICIPGQKGACSVNSCEMGYATCNSCGTAYENCTPASAPS